MQRIKWRKIISLPFKILYAIFVLSALAYYLAGALCEIIVFYIEDQNNG